jgi:hexulose-6-phosphate isomerase
MRKGITAFSYPRDFPVDKIIENAAEIGYEGVELLFDKERLNPLELTEEEQKRILEKMSSLDIILSSFDLAIPLYLANPDKALRKKGIETVRKACKVASYMGAKVIAVVLTTVVPIQVKYEKIWETSKKSLLEISKTATDTGIYIGVENIWNNFLYSPLEFKRFINEINSEYVKAYFDVGNCVLYGSPQQWIEVLGHDIVCVHVKDFNTELDYIRLNRDFKAVTYPSRPLLQGNIDWKAILAALKKVGYDYFLNVEVPPYPNNPTKSALDNKAALDIILGTSAHL